MGKSWLYLVLAGCFEIGWPIGLKFAVADGPYRALGFAMAVASMLVSGGLLWTAQKVIPMGTAYAVWTGIGAAGTCLVGVIFFGEPVSLTRLAGVGLIVSGVIVLKLAH